MISSACKRETPSPATIISPVALTRSSRLDGLATPTAAKLNRKKFDTPSTSRLKNSGPQSSPDVKTAMAVDRHPDALNASS